MAVINLNKCQRVVLTVVLVTTILPSSSEGLWFFQQPQQQDDHQQEPQQQQEQLSQLSEQTSQQQDAPSKSPTVIQQQQPSGSLGSRLSGYGTRLLSIAGIQPASIASLLNTVGDTGFRYFNIQDQCRNRAACDLGTSVKTLTDINNIYTQSWLEGMVGRNCTALYAACRESPLEGLMNLAMLQQLAMSNTATNQLAASSVPATVAPVQSPVT